MRTFYLEYKLVLPVAAQLNELEHLGVLMQISWSHNIILMEKIDSIEQRLWYAEKTVENRITEAEILTEKIKNYISKAKSDATRKYYNRG